MDKEIKLHVICSKNVFSSLILEMNSEYHWLSLYLAKKYRDRKTSKKIVKHAINQVLIGHHRVHMFPSMTSMKQLARTMQWKKIGESEIFENCIVYKIKSKQSDIEILNFDITTKTFSRYPKSIKKILPEKIYSEIILILKNKYK